MQKKEKNDKKNMNKNEDLIEKDAANAVDGPAGQEAELDEELSAIESFEQGDEDKQEVNETISKLTKDKEEYINMLKRERADFENYKRRNADLAAVSYMNGVGDTVKSILPSVDNLERALAASCADNALKEGIQMIQRQLLETLAAYGLEEVQAQGLQFDPECMNAVMQVEKEEGQESNMVAEVLQKGYKLRGKLLRCAMVKVVQ